MAVKHAVLRVLLEGSQHRYSVHRRVRELGLRYAASTVYDAVDDLLKDGLVRDTGDAWFEVTERGLEFFADWMREDGDGKPPPLRSSLLMKLALTTETPAELAHLHAECVRQEQYCVEQLEGVDRDEALEQLLPNAPKEWQTTREQLLHDAEHAHMTATIAYVSGVRREAREAYERLTGEPLEPTT